MTEKVIVRKAQLYRTFILGMKYRITTCNEKVYTTRTATSVKWMY